MKETTNFGLALYEPNDLSNLTDGYNESMNIIDENLYKYVTTVSTIVPFDNAPTTGSTKGVTSAGVKTYVDKVQTNLNAITPFDSTPTAGSAKGVTSAGVKTYVDKVQTNLNTITPFDSTPTVGSAKGVTSAGIRNYVNAEVTKIDNELHSDSTTIFGTSAYTDYDSVVTKDSNNLITSGAVYNFASKDSLSFSGKNSITIGDSIMLGTGTTTPTTDGLHAQLAKMLNTTNYNYAKNQAGFNVTNNTYLAQLNSAYAEHPDGIDLIIISGGINDATNETYASGVYNAAVTLFNTAQQYYPNATIICAPMQAYSNCKVNNAIQIWSKANSKRNPTVYKYILQACADCNIKCIKSCHQWLTNQPSLYTDTVHPNSDGAKQQAIKIVSDIFGGTLLPSFNIPYSVNSNISSSDNFNIAIENGIISIAGTLVPNTTIAQFTTLVYFDSGLENNISCSILYNNSGTFTYAGGYVAPEVIGTANNLANSDLMFNTTYIPGCN